MSPAALLRTASVVSLLFAAGHTLGGSESWSPPGETRSYLDFYRGFGYTISVQLLLQAVLLWQLSRIEPKRARPLIASFLLACLILALVAWRLIFASTLLSRWAGLALRREQPFRVWSGCGRKQEVTRRAPAQRSSGRSIRFGVSLT